MIVINPVTVGLAAGSALLGGFGNQSKANAERRKQRKLNEWAREDHKRTRKKIKADHKQNLKEWRAAVGNEERRASWIDQTNLDNYNYQLKINDFEYRSQMRQYAKSEQLYGEQLNFNQLAAKEANSNAYRQLQDATNELAFQNQDIVIKAMESEGLTAVKGQSGRSAAKGEQANLASLGRSQAVLAESLLSAKSEASANLRKIAIDKYGADLAANAARMLQPERNPLPPKPLETPRAEIVKPRKLRDFDFPVAPVEGSAPSSSSAWLGAAMDFGTSVAGSLINYGGGGSGSKYGGNYDLSFNFG